MLDGLERRLYESQRSNVVAFIHLRFRVRARPVINAMTKSADAAAVSTGRHNHHFFRIAELIERRSSRQQMAATC